jgi:hypothetical protein
MLSREPAEEPRREQGIVTLWLIHLTKYSRQHIACFLKIQDLTPMIGPKKLRRPLRIGRLIEAGFGKSNAESAKPFGADMLGCQGRHRGGVDPAAEKDPQGNICHQPALDRTLQYLDEFFAKFRSGAPHHLVIGLDLKPPIAPRHRRVSHIDN